MAAAVVLHRLLKEEEGEPNRTFIGRVSLVVRYNGRKGPASPSTGSAEKNRQPKQAGNQGSP